MRKISVIIVVVVSAIYCHGGTEVLKNGNFKEWNEKGLPIGWHSRNAIKDLSIVNSDTPSVKVVGRTGQLTTRIKLKEGQHYRVTGWIYKAGSRNYGCIGLRTKDYKWLLVLKGSKETGDWKKVSAIYKASGNEFYFYCANWYIGKEEACFFSSLSVEELTPEEAAAVSK